MYMHIKTIECLLFVTLLGPLNTAYHTLVQLPIHLTTQQATILKNSSDSRSVEQTFPWESDLLFFHRRLQSFHELLIGFFIMPALAMSQMFLEASWEIRFKITTWTFK